MMSRSVWASAAFGVSSRNRIVEILANKEAEERPGEERRADVAVLQRERRAQAIAVGEQDQRQVPRRYLENQRRVRARRVAELPVERLPVVVLHEPAEPRRHRVIL